jgi:hypothetical protein
MKFGTEYFHRNVKRAVFLGYYAAYGDNSLTDVSRQPVGLIFKSREIQEELLLHLADRK